MTERNSIIAAAVLVALAIVLIVTAGPSDKKRTSQPTDPVRAEVTLNRTSRVGEAVMDARQVIRLGPEDWKRRFAEMGEGLSGENRRDILELAEELNHALSTGGDPAGVDAEIYAEAILTLLNEHTGTLIVDSEESGDSKSFW